MNAQALKNSILQLAIQGKLVEQRGEEGTAKELIQKIEAEKKQLIKEGKIKKRKALTPIKEDEIPFDIPDSWEWVRHNGLFEIIGGSQPPKSFFKEIEKEGYIRLYQIRDYGDKPAPVYVPKSKVSKFSKKGDILLARYGASVGKVFIAEDGAYNVAMAKSTQLFSSELIDTNYMYFYYLAPLYQKLVRQNSRSAQAGFNKDDLDSLLIPLPPLEEQKRIVEKIEELMPYVDKYDVAYSEVEELNENFPEDMQKSILQYAIQGKLVEQREEDGTAEELYQHIQEEKKKLIREGKIKKTKALPEITEDEIPFDIPENWKWVYVDDIAFVTKLAGFEYTKYMSTAILPKGEIPIVRAKNIKPNNFMENEEEFITRELSEKLSRCALDARCMLMTFIGAGIGEVAIFENKRRNHLAPNVAKIVPHLDMNDYLLYYLMSYTGQREIFKYMKSTAQPSLSMETIRKVIVPLPPLDEQKRIVEKVEELLPYAKQLIR